MQDTANGIIFVHLNVKLIHKIVNFTKKIAGIAQLVERNLAKVDVAGSSPVSRSVFLHGDVPKWLKGEVCKTFIHRFESDRRLKN